jgi:pyruvate,orthophosphate dikinase
MRHLRVRVNADAPADASAATGAEGIGPCRTEHMFFEETVIAMREMIGPGTAGARALAKLPRCSGRLRGHLPRDGGLSVCIRLLDPPLHEFLPKKTRDQGLAKALAANRKTSPRACSLCRETNPMLGLRLPAGIIYPEISMMQPAPSSSGVCRGVRRAEI